MKGRILAWPAVFATVLLLSACAGSGSTSSGNGETKITVFAAASLSKVLPAIGRMFTEKNPEVSLKFEFAGTDTLAAQIEQGAPADVFAGASTKYGEELFGKGLIDAPRPFATNTLVLIVPPSNPAHITLPKDLQAKGIKLVMGGPTVPVGAYTRTVLANLDATYGKSFDSRVLANVVSNEDAVSSVLQKVRLGEADAGFVYVTDVKAAGLAVRAIPLSAAAQAIATYPIAAVAAGAERASARAFVAYVLTPPAQDVLRAAGFGSPPSG